MWLRLNTPVNIAHRGDSAHAPENTLAAFRMAEINGADAVEFDVKLTCDRQVIILHDQSLDRTTNGQGKVHKLSLAAIRELDAGSGFDEKYKNEKIPTLGEVFESLGSGMHMNIELTNYFTPNDDLVSQVAALVKKSNVQDRILFSSFFLQNLREVKRLLPDVPCGILASGGMKGFPARRWGWKGGMDALHPYISDVNETLVKEVHDKGKRIQVWTVNKPVEMEKLMALGVDGVFTDDPGLLKQVLGKRR